MRAAALGAMLALWVACVSLPGCLLQPLPGCDEPGWEAAGDRCRQRSCEEMETHYFQLHPRRPDTVDWGVAEAAMGSCYFPPRLEVAAGTVVHFVAGPETSGHPSAVVALQEGDEPPYLDALVLQHVPSDQPEGNVTTYRFDEPGRYAMICLFHTGMGMTEIIVA